MPKKVKLPPGKTYQAKQTRAKTRNPAAVVQPTMIPGVNSLMMTGQTPVGPGMSVTSHKRFKHK